MTDEQRKKAIEIAIARNEREKRRRENRIIMPKNDVSHNAVAGTMASVRAGAVEGAKNTIFNAKAFAQSDVGTGKRAALQTAERAVRDDVDYDDFKKEMTAKYGKWQGAWMMRMTDDERDMLASALQRKKLGINSMTDLERSRAQERDKLNEIQQERAVRSMQSQERLQAVNDRYELGRVGEFAQELGGALGNMAPSLAVGLVNPAAGFGLMAAQAAAQGYGQALDSGATHEQAALYGAGTGALEAGVERLTGGLSRFYGKGLLLNPVKNSSVKNVFLNTARSAAGEGAEEAIQGFADPFLQRATYDPDAPNATLEELAHQAAIGAAMGGILGGGSNVVDYRAGKKAAERAQTGVQWAQGERTTIDTSAQNVGLNGDVGSRRTAENVMNDVNPPKTPYEQAYDDMLKGEDRAKPKADPEDERRVKNFIQSAAVRARMQVEYVDRPLSQKAYYSDGKIYINKNRPFDDAMKITVAHELYHGMEGTKEHDAIVKLAFEGKDAEAMIAEKINSYRERGIELDETGARAEIGADFIERAMTDEATINQVLLENRTLAGKIVERIKEIIDIYRAKKTMFAKDAQEYAALLKAKRLYEDGLEKLHEGEYAPAGTERSARYSFLGKNKNGIEVYETSDEIKKLPYKERKNKFLDLMRNEYRGRTAKFTIGNETYYARFEEDDLKKNIYGDDASDKHGYKAKINVGASGDIFELVENTRYDDSKKESGKNTKAHKGVISWDYFVKQVQIDGRVYDLLANVRKKTDGEYVYNIQLKENKKIEASPYVVDGQAATSIEGQHASINNNNIPNPATNVNSKSQKNEKRFALDESYQEDNTGAKLSKQQQEYFKDSKIRDKDGNLVRVYHNTNNDFTVFDLAKSGSNQGSSKGQGIYLSKRKGEFAHSDYGDKQMNLYANITNPFDINKSGLSEEQADYVLNKYASKKHNLDEYDGLYRNHAKGKLMNNYRMMDYIKEYADDNGISTIDIMRDLGYDGILDGAEVVAFSPEQVKNVDNESPTSNPDIRYSLDTKGEKDYQKRSKYLANSDENLQNFMKDSVVKNEDGTPKVVYSGHGNSNLFGGAWDIKKATSGGFYFTENPDIASSYAKDKLGNMETYADGDEYRFKNAKGEYKDTIDKVRLNEEQAAKFDAWLKDDMGMNFDDYVRENAPYDKLLQGLRYNGGKYNLQNVYKLMESLGYADNGWNYSTNSRGKSTFEELLDDMGIEWDSYTRDAGGVFPVYLDIRNPIDTSKPFPQDLLNELEYQASKERKSADADSAHWTKDYPLKEWVEDIKRGAEGWATQVPTKARKIMLDLGYDGIKDTGGKMLGDTNHTVWVALEPTQIKSATGNRGTFDASKKDIRYAVDEESQGSGTSDAMSGMDFESDSETKSRYDELIDRYGRMEAGMEPRVDVAVPKRTSDWDKTRKFTRTVLESENISEEAKERIKDSVASDVQSGKFVYNPISNKELQEKANQRIATNGYDDEKAALFAKYRSNERITAEDVATLQQLMVIASDEKLAIDVEDISGLAAIIGTEMGQSIQALSMVKRMSPEGRLRQMQLLRDRLNSKYDLNGDKKIEVNKRYEEMLLDKNNSSENMDTIQEYIINDMAQQLPVNMADKFDAWRYLAMLGNPRTHMRNVIGNILNLSISRLNDQLAGIVEAAIIKNGGERTKSAGTVSKELKEFAKADWENNGRKRTDLSNKYGERGQAERNRKIFTSKLMQPVEKARKLNEQAMDWEDTIFKKTQYIYALSHYMKANNISIETMRNESSQIAERARQYAEQEAYRVTFQEANEFANMLNRLEHKKTDKKSVKALQFGTKALMPFKKTPLNILNRGVEYSPVGLLNGLSDALRLVRKGDIPATQVINEITQGMTGTGVVLLGYFLAEMGLLSSGYDEGNKREQNYENQIGGQNYALTLPNGSYSLDWAAPAAMPLFVGAALHNDIVSRNGGESIGIGDVGHALIKVTDPVLEMSCMDSLQSALESYGNEGATSNMIVSAVKSYALQYVPTLSGQVARSVDDTKRSTYAPKDSKYSKTGESLGRQFMNKVPGLSFENEAAIDVWGRERKQAGSNIVSRAAFNMLSPGTYTPNTATKTDEELKRLYQASGDSGILPKTGNKYITFKSDDGVSKTYYLTAKEYTKYQKKYGGDNFNAVSELMRSNVYKKMSDEEKAAAVKEIYSYNAKMANKEFFKGRGVSYDAGDTMSAKLKDAGGWDKYFAIKNAFPESNYEVAKKRKDKCDKYGIDYTAYAESTDEIKALREANSERFKKIEESGQKVNKTESNKRAIAKYLASRKDLTDPQRQVIWQEYYNGKTSETYKSVARRYGF